jgi:hypothetical protein
MFEAILGGIATTNQVIQVDVTVLTFALGTVIPLLVGLVTKLTATAQLKSILNLVISVAAGVLAVWIQAGGTITLMMLATAAFTTYMASQVTYHGLWKPTGAVDAISAATPNLGLGSGFTLNSPVVVQPPLVDTPPAPATPLPPAVAGVPVETPAATPVVGSK